MDEKRRRFFGFLGLGAIGSTLGIRRLGKMEQEKYKFSTTELKLPPQDPNSGLTEQDYREFFIQDLYARWDSRIENFNPHLKSEELIRLRHMVTPIRKKKESQRNKLEKDLIYFYNGVKIPYLIALRSVQLSNLATTDHNPNNFSRKIRFQDRSIVGDQIYFAEINERFAITLTELCQRNNVCRRAVYMIATIENNFGLNKTSNKDALGPMQVRREMIDDVEKEFNLNPRFDSLPTSDRTHRLIIVGVLAVKMLVSQLNLTSLKGYDAVANAKELLLLELCYHSGVDNILEVDPTEPFKKNGREAGSEAMASLHFDFKYLEKNPNQQLAQVNR